MYYEDNKGPVAVLRWGGNGHCLPPPPPQFDGLPLPPPVVVPQCFLRKHYCPCTIRPIVLTVGNGWKRLEITIEIMN